MKLFEVREKYLKFFQERGHKIIPSSSLIPENDPTTLFTGSGMQPLVPYLLGEQHPQGMRLADSQKSFRTEDIEEIGDNRHTTFFEMLGNWSLGNYFKEEQIQWIFEFLTKEIGLNPKNLYVTVFKGNEEFNLPKDEESADIWKRMFSSVGIEAGADRIFYYSEKKNWWSRPGVPSKMPIGEPGGPNSEVFWDFGVDLKIHESSPYKDEACHPNCDCGRFLEIGNNVFMKYKKTKDGFEDLPKKNVDFGGGLERITAVSNNNPDVFLADLFEIPISIIEKVSNKKYDESEKTIKAFRVILDHIRASVFLISDGAVPSNKDQGYFTRRLVRRAICFGNDIGILSDICAEVGRSFIEEYKEIYPELEKNKEAILKELTGEEDKFKITLEKGLKKFNEMLGKNGSEEISSHDVFDLYQTYGFPFEMTKELAKEKGIIVSDEDFKKWIEEHQEVSRKGAEKKFKGGLADSGEETRRLHTATHLLQSALRRVLGEGIFQKGSNITSERLRFDFSYGEKMTEERIKEVERIVNEWIKQDIEVVCEELSYESAKEKGATGLFEDKYSDIVKVYSIGDASCEICGGPHAKRTSELGIFKIIKEESSSSGIRRIKAIISK